VQTCDEEQSYAIRLRRALMIISGLAKLDLSDQTHCNSKILFHPKMTLHLF